MIEIIKRSDLGHVKHGWLDTLHHFSFASYYNPDKMGFGILRVINDDLVSPHQGFDTHPHANMEIISYVVSGKLTHGDSMQNLRTITRGQVQYMSAGTGVWHSEKNQADEPLRFIQIWVLPNQQNLTPAYGDVPLAWEERIDRWLPLASGQANSPAPIKVHGDINLFATEISAGKSLDFQVDAQRQVYLLLLEGDAQIQSIEQKLDPVKSKDNNPVTAYTLLPHEALTATDELLSIQTQSGAHILLFEMNKSIN